MSKKKKVSRRKSGKRLHHPLLFFAIAAIALSFVFFSTGRQHTEPDTAVLAEEISIPNAVSDPVTTPAAQYPDLKTIPPKGLILDQERLNNNDKKNKDKKDKKNNKGGGRYILRFANTVWNAGEGPLEIRSERINRNRSRAFQVVYSTDGSKTERVTGDMVFHDAHNHWHFENFAKYELWRREVYDRWIASGRTNGAASLNGSKVTFCIIDYTVYQELPNTPGSPAYNSCGRAFQGLSVGWGDTYVRSFPDQWIVIGRNTLRNGRYVLRSVADPNNIIQESAEGDPTRESREANEAVTFFRVRNGKVQPE